jgi:hypothetical protein
MGNVATVHMCISEQTLETFEIDQASLKLNQDNQQIELKIQKINLKCQFSMNLWT